jgi:hypothetical protein
VVRTGSKFRKHRQIGGTDREDMFMERLERAGGQAGRAIRRAGRKGRQEGRQGSARVALNCAWHMLTG